MIKNSQPRQSNFEVLRILCIAFIIAFHYVNKAGFYFEGMPIGNRILADIIYQVGPLGVNCFILISGYFFDTTHFRWKKVLLILFQLWFYLLFCRGLLILTGYAQWNTWGLGAYLFPILRLSYWFITAYVLIYILTPYLKKFVLALSQKELGTLIALQLMIWSVYPTVILGFYGSNNTEEMPCYNRYIWLLVVYLIGAYIKLYGLRFLRDIKKALIFEAGVAGAILAYILLVETSILAVGKIPYYFWPPNSLLQIMLSVGLFGIFLHLKIPYHKSINYAASCTMGIYMLHEGDLTNFWWQIVFKTTDYQRDPSLARHILLAVLVIMLLGVLLETVRKVLELPVISLLNKLEAKWAQRNCAQSTHSITE